MSIQNEAIPGRGSFSWAGLKLGLEVVGRSEIGKRKSHNHFGLK